MNTCCPRMKDQHSGTSALSCPGRADAPTRQFEYERMVRWRIWLLGMCGAPVCLANTSKAPESTPMPPGRSCNAAGTLSFRQTCVWVTDNGSSHRGSVSVKRLAQWYPHAVQVHTPVHASWLNQVEIYFSIVQRKVLTPSDFPNLQAVEETLLKFQTRYEQQAKPFEWKFSREDLDRLLRKLAQDEDARREALAQAA